VPRDDDFDVIYFVALHSTEFNKTHHISTWVCFVGNGRGGNFLFVACLVKVEAKDPVQLPRYCFFENLLSSPCWLHSAGNGKN
jgi:hypothetical protein